MIYIIKYSILKKQKYMKMEINILGILKMIKKKEKEYYIIIMEIDMKVILNQGKKKEKEYIIIITEIDMKMKMKMNGKIILQKEKEFIFIKKVTNISK